jgi:NADPH:quinone reductase-like Zn-dependent oxidoreductase
MTDDGTTMQAFVRDRYGSPDVLRLERVPRPPLTDDGVLVRVRATSVNALEWHTLRGKPYIARLTDGLRRPKSALLGTDVAGVVEAVGTNVTDLEPGDEVFGSRTGAFAEYVSGRNLVRMPKGLTFEQAAAVSVAGQTALQGLRDKGRLRAGQRVLINGAGGGVGTFAVQIAKALGAEVTAVTSTPNLEMARSIGADHVLDYTREDFTRGPGLYDLVLDIGGNRSLSSMRRTLTPGGTVVLVAPSPGQWVGPVARVLAAVATSRFTDRKVLPFLSSVRRDDLLVLKDLIESGKVVPVIDRTYAFEQLPDAIRHVESGRASGKVVVTVD